MLLVIWERLHNWTIIEKKQKLSPESVQNRLWWVHLSQHLLWSLWQSIGELHRHEHCQVCESEEGGPQCWAGQRSQTSLHCWRCDHSQARTPRGSGDCCWSWAQAVSGCWGAGRWGRSWGCPQSPCCPGSPGRRSDCPGARRNWRGNGAAATSGLSLTLWRALGRVWNTVKSEGSLSLYIPLVFNI